MTASRRPRWLWWLVSAMGGLTALALAVLAWLRPRAGEPARPLPPAAPAPPTMASPPVVSPSAASPATVSPPGPATEPPASGGTGVACHPGCHGACRESCDGTCSRACDEATKSCDSSIGGCDSAATCHSGSGCGHVQGCSGVGTGLLAAWCAVGPGVARRRVTWPARAGVLAVRGYQRWLSPRIGAHCRYRPSCSAYGIDALKVFGAWTGGRLTAARIRRCTPEVPCGTPDPVRTGAAR